MDRAPDPLRLRLAAALLMASSSMRTARRARAGAGEVAGAGYLGELRRVADFTLRCGCRCS